MEEREHTYVENKPMHYGFKPKEYIDIAKLTDPVKDVKTTGKIMSSESRITKTGRVMYNLLIADDDYNAIRATIFENKTMPKKS